jgi:hypothetical protein
MIKAKRGGWDENAIQALRDSVQPPTQNGSMQQKRLMTEEEEIGDKFVAIPKVDVMTTIINERGVEIEKIHMGLVDIHDMHVDLSQLVQQQGRLIDQIDNHCESAHGYARQGLSNVIVANSIDKDGVMVAMSDGDAKQSIDRGKKVNPPSSSSDKKLTSTSNINKAESKGLLSFFSFNSSLKLGSEHK